MDISLPSASIMNSKHFLYGVATASFQIEGGIDSRLPCIWDTFCAQNVSHMQGKRLSIPPSI